MFQKFLALALIAGCAQAFAEAQIVSCVESAKSSMNRSALLVVPQRDGAISDGLLTVQDDEDNVIGVAKSPVVGELADVEHSVKYTTKTSPKMSLKIPFSESEKFEAELNIAGSANGQFDGAAIMDCTAQYY